MTWSLIQQMGGGMGGTGSFAFLGPFLGLLIMGTVVYLLWVVISGNSALQAHSNPSDGAIERLRERYARGEIDDENFEKRVQKLRSQ